ncbi:MAG: hypothetical protein ACXAE3_08980 [Candidatus Kariarchaeaceae archaeon]|jgi:hypothetical protein
MDFAKILRTLLLITLVGTSLTFSSTLLRNSAETVENTNDNELASNWKEIVLYLFLLEVLGVAIYILFLALAKLANYRVDDLFLLVSPDGRWAIA